MVQDMGHTIGQHAKIFCTTEHLRLADSCRKTMDGILSPEEIMTLVEEVVI